MDLNGLHRGINREMTTKELEKLLLVALNQVLYEIQISEKNIKSIYAMEYSPWNANVEYFIIREKLQIANCEMWCK